MGQVGWHGGGTLLRVLVGSGGRWEVKEPGSSAPILAHRPTQPEAVEAARQLLAAGGVVHVFDTEGFVEHVLPVPARNVVRPPHSWWHQRKELSLLWVLIGVAMLGRGALRLAFRHDGVTLCWACLQIAAGLVFVGLGALASRRHRQALRAAAERLDSLQRQQR